MGTDLCVVNGKDVTIWTAVETATAIVAGSIPVLRVFFREKASTHGSERNKREDSNHVELNTYRGGTVKSSVATTLPIAPAPTPIGGVVADDSKKWVLPEVTEIRLSLDMIMETTVVDIENQADVD